MRQDEVAEKVGIRMVLIACVKVQGAVIQASKGLDPSLEHSPGVVRAGIDGDCDAVWKDDDGNEEVGIHDNIISSNGNHFYGLQDGRGHFKGWE